MKGFALVLVLVVAATMVIGVAGLPPHGDPDGPIHTHVGARYLEQGVAETGLRNLVTAVLLVYRGFDTFLEVVVIFTALVAVLALPSATRRPPPARDAATAALRRGADDAVPVSPVVFLVVRLLAPFIAVFALASLYRGHVTPGGGFQSAAIIGAMMIALGLVFGRAHAARLVPHGAKAWLQALGPLAFAITAFVGWRLTGAFLGFPADEAAHALREAMVVVLEVAIAVGGAVILAQLFMALDAPT